MSTQPASVAPEPENPQGGHDQPGQPEPTGVRWGVLHAVGALLASFLVPLGVVAGLAGLGVDRVTSTLIGNVAGWIPLSGWPIFVVHRWGHGVRNDLAWLFRKRDLLIGPVAGCAMLVATSVGYGIYVALGGEMPSSNVGEIAGVARQNWQIVALAAMSIAAPFVEELHFRGMWWSALRRAGLRPVVTLFVTAAIFGVSHLEPSRIIFLVAAGLILGYLRMWQDRLGPSIIAHVVINGFAAAGLLLTL